MFDSATPRFSTRSAAARHVSGTAIPAAQLTRVVGDGHRVLAPGGDETLALMSGRFLLARLRDGLYLHCTDVEHLQDMTARFPVLEGGVKVLLKLEGNAEVSFGGTPLHLNAGQGRAAQPRGAVFNLAGPEDFERRCRAGTRERMVVLTMTPGWFEASGIDARRFGRHLAVHAWQPSARAVAIAEQLVRPDGFVGEMQSLFQESRALELIGEALGRHGGTLAAPATSAGLRPADHRRVVRLRGSLQSGEFDALDMAAIAREMGCNANTLQRHFRQVFGESIFDHLRGCRLRRAADALRLQCVSVAQAAEIAGYGSQANFSTAFRRHFGISPKHARARL